MTAARMLSTRIYLAICLPDWNSLDSVRRAHSRLELASIIFFGLLAVTEAFAHRSKEEKRKHLLDTFGIIFFVIAVVAEGAAYPYGQRNDALSENVIRSLDAVAKDAFSKAKEAETKAASADSKAGDAAKTSQTALTNAGKATAKAAQVGEEADALTSRMADMNGEFVAIEPRAVVIAKNEASLVEETLPFAGQKFEVQICGPWDLLEPVSREKIDARFVLQRILQKKSKWEDENELQWSWKKCSGFSGASVFFSASSSANTKAAAKALSGELTAALPDQMFRMFVPVGPVVTPPLDDADSGLLWASKHPDVVVVVFADRIPPDSKPTARPNAKP